MVLGMSLSAFTTVHVIISLIGIVSGLVVMFGLLGSNRMAGMTALFLLTTILTSATGFLFPFEKLLPSNLLKEETTTPRAGMLIPRDSVSVANTTLMRPR